MNNPVAPSKCKACNKLLNEVVVCDYCHSLNPESLMTDFFTLLGVPRRYDIDEKELQQKFIAINRHAHPDRHTEDSGEVQQLSLVLSAAVNDAYRTLSDPALRGAYLLELFGGKSSAADKNVPDGFLGTMMMMQEELADAKAAGKGDEVSRLRDVAAKQQDGLIRRIAALFESYQESISCSAIRTDLLDEIRKQLNAVSYVKKFLSQIRG